MFDYFCQNNIPKQIYMYVHVTKTVGFLSLVKLLYYYVLVINHIFALSLKNMTINCLYKKFYFEWKKNIVLFNMDYHICSWNYKNFGQAYQKKKLIC